MSERFQMPKLSARNPLGIIALFISLIYAMSVSLLGVSVGSLAFYNQTILVVFVALFPFVVLWVFSWLVAKHHKKLYGPGDYRSDEGFLNAADSSPARTLGERLSADIDADEKGKVTDGPPSETPPPHQPESTLASSLDRISPRGTIDAPFARREDLMARAYIAEGLVFQDLQNEFGGSVRREVVFPVKGSRPLRADGVIHAAGEMIVVEVKMTRFVGNLVRRLREATNQVESYRRAIQESGVVGARFIIALVLDGDGISEAARRMVQRYHDGVGGDLQVRLFSYQALLQKYGFPTDESGAA
ncbi:hypothetical protein [Magnetospirillum fulvum]|nr:hypothetical protein [Magnetospirillum fulvum]